MRNYITTIEVFYDSTAVRTHTAIYCTTYLAVDYRFNDVIRE